MAIARPFVTPAARPAIARPPSFGKLGTVQLVGDVQTYWEQLASLYGAGSTVYDAVGYDSRDHLVIDPPDATIQVGDCSDYIAPDKATLFLRFDMARAWAAQYSMDDDRPWYWVMGNHDCVGYPNQPALISAQGWAQHLGYPASSYALDMGEYRILVIGPTGTGEEMTPLAGGPVPVRPMQHSDLAWLEARLAEDTRPTLLVAHAPIYGMSTHDGQTSWIAGQSTVEGGYRANDLRAIIDRHRHAVAWLHGHTHSKWNAAPSNVSRYNTGTRLISVVDAGPLFQRPRFNDRTPAITFWVSLLDDGRTLDVRWRDHDHGIWSAADGQSVFWRGTST